MSKDYIIKVWTKKDGYCSFNSNRQKNTAPDLTEAVNYSIRELYSLIIPNLF